MGGKFVDNQFSGIDALYGNWNPDAYKGLMDWKKSVWRPIDELNDDTGKPVKGKLVLHDGFTADEISQG